MSADRTDAPWAVGDQADVKCSDTRWRRAECVDDRGVLAWRFSDGALRRVDNSTAREVTP